MLRLIALDLRQLLRERLALVILLVALAACALAFVNGRALMSQQIEGRAISAKEDAETAKSFREGLAKPTPPEEAILRAVRVSLPIAASVPPLADFSAGRAGFESYTTVVRLRARADTLFKRTQLDNPELLARGSLDLGFVAIVIAPLLLIGLGYGLFVADRDSGAARLILAQGGTPTRLLAARSVLRLGLMMVPIAVAAAALLWLGPDLEGRMTAAWRWLGLALLLIAFWWAAILLVNSLRITAETAALVLVSLWALLTLILPILIAAAAQLAYPPPSRFAEIAAARAAEVSATTAYENDHPDLASEDFAGRLASVRKSLEIGTTIDRAVKPVSDRFADRLAEQQRLSQTVRYLSPPLVAGDALADIAGTGSGAQLAFRRATADYLVRLKSALRATIEAGRPLSGADYDSLPRFAFLRPTPATAWPALFLALLTGAVFFGAIARFRRLRLD